MQSAVPIILQTGQHWLEFFPLKIPALSFFKKKRGGGTTKRIFAEKFNYYLRQYKFEAYFIFKDHLKCYTCHPCHLFSLKKQCKAYAKFQWEHLQSFTTDFHENGLTSSSSSGFDL